MCFIIIIIIIIIIVIINLFRVNSIRLYNKILYSVALS